MPAAGRRVANGVSMLVVPGSMRVRAQAEAKGLDAVAAATAVAGRLRVPADLPPVSR